MTSEENQAALAAIEGLEIGDCLLFFDESKDERAQKIVDLCDSGDEDFEIDFTHVSEGQDNGAYVLGWRWVSFDGTELDKDLEVE